MIRNSFIFLDGIRQASEKRIWGEGVTDWNGFLDAEKLKGFSKARKCFYDAQIKRASKALFDYDSSFFTDKLPNSEAWRLYDHFKEDAVFLDIETTGYHGSITVIGLFNGRETKSYVKGVNLDSDKLSAELRKYKLIITFNGSSFDIPIIKKYFGNIIPNIPHIDLKHCCSRIGLVGGLKRIEQQLSLRRPEHLSNLNGEHAVWLWRAYKASGRQDYLDTLIQYNEEDIVNLKPIADLCYDRLRQTNINHFRKPSADGRDKAEAGLY